MKNVLILVLSSDFSPYNKMIDTSCKTWDSIPVEGVETIFYCSQKDNPQGQSNDKLRYFDVGNSLFDMGHKNLAMYEWALANKEFDYVARVNASCYVDKKQLIKYVQDLPAENVFAGVKAESQHGGFYLWGGCQTIISRDVIQQFVENKHKWQHRFMEDEAMSFLATMLGIPFSNDMKSCSIDKFGDEWLCISYCGKSKKFTSFDELNPPDHIFYRVKQDGKRSVDEIIMKELFKHLI